MPEYLVRWEMDIVADSPQEAAQKALEIHRDEDSIATHFLVYQRPTWALTEVDLMEEE